jgi:hypothetical protein
MKRHTVLMLMFGIVLVFATALRAKNLDTEGKVWLDAHNEPATINVHGVWQEKKWRYIELNQAAGSRELTGYGDGWVVTGVVSGKQVFLIFSHQGKIAYSAELAAQGENILYGSYSRGLMNDKSVRIPMRLTKR